MPSLRRPAAALTAVGALALAYVLGVATPRSGSTPEPRAASVLDSAAALLSTRALTPVGRQALDRAAVQGMLLALDDRWAGYYPPAQLTAFTDSLEGRFTGVGLFLRPGSGSSLEVGSVTAHTSAARAGVRPGDRLVAVDGGAPKGLAQAAALLRGPAGSSVRLRLARGATARTLVLRRQQFATVPVATSRLPGATVIRVESFTRGVGRQVRDRVRAPHSASLVLDLRGNPGGLLDEAVEVASAFLSGGAVVSYDRRGEGTRTLSAVGSADTTTPLVVLVDGGTASAAEVVAGALQDRGRAVIVGARTFGKGSVQEAQQLPDGSVLEITVGHYRTPAGHDLDGRGVQPDIEIASGAAAGVAERRAQDVLLGLRASLPGAS